MRMLVPQSKGMPRIAARLPIPGRPWGAPMKVVDALKSSESGRRSILGGRRSEPRPEAISGQKESRSHLLGCGHLASQARHVSLQASKFLLLAGVQFWNCSLHISLHDFWASWMPSIGRE
jgi:hypothetical protein